MGKGLIEPRVLKGFRDTMPDLAILRQRMLRSLEEVFTSFGFVPIDTPALEYSEILLGKGSAETDKQLYRFKDNGERDVALRFDLTVPLARFVSAHVNELGTPFKRYHIAPVWRAEKPQRGRYREFIQCDFDIIGPQSVYADAEILGVIHGSMEKLGIGHHIRVNNRMVLNGMLEGLGVRERSGSVLRAIDKFDKIGAEGVTAELKREAGLVDGQIERVFSYVKLSQTENSGEDLLKELERFLAGSELGLRGTAQLRALLETSEVYGIDPAHVRIDLSIARGLDYYTGTVFETVFEDLPEIGSICSGGRYDDLASLYISRKLPGVGASIGLDRILGALEALEAYEKRFSTADVLVTLLDVSSAAKAIEIGASIRRTGVAVEVFPEIDHLGAQLKYADRKGIRFAVILGEQELRSGTCGVKNLKTKEQRNDIPFGEVGRVVKEMVNS